MTTTNEPHDELQRRDIIRKLAEEFAESLRNAGQPKLEDYLARVDPSCRDALQEELVGEEFAYRFGDATQNGRLRYRPIAILGKGAFGEVYKAIDEELDRNVAIKVLLRTEASAKQRFLTEARRQANLPKHSHLIAIFDSGTLPNGHAFAIMEYLDGGSLRAKIESDGRLDAETAAQLMEQIALAVSAVHEGTRGSGRHPTPALVHRDLKPENILLDRMGNAHVADFGIAAAVADLHSGPVGAGGTIAYMSPEQALNFRSGRTTASIDTRSDVWALGVILYELLTGKKPFARPSGTPDDILEAIIRYEPPQMRDLCPGVPPELERLGGECLKKEVAERIASASEVAKRLRRWLDSVSAIPAPLDFSARLDEARKDFTDRPWLFDKVAAWLTHQNERLLLLTGELGSGKSAFLAELIYRNTERRILAWHLCQHDRPESRSAAKFVRSFAGMLATRVEGYRCKLADLSLREALRIENCEHDPASAFETAVDTPLRNSPPPGEGTFTLIVDALDEADLSSQASLANLLAQWARKLPGWLRIIASARRGAVCESELSSFRILDVDRDNTDHVNDVRDDIQRFLGHRLNQPNLAERLRQAGISAQTVANQFVEKSEANFLYVAEALVAIECDRLSFTDIDSFPPGLAGLYSEFFRRQWPDRHRFTEVRPILEALVVAREGLDEGLLASATKLDRYQLNDRLGQLAQYLDRSPDGVRIRHLALKEWLTSTSGLYYINIQTGHRGLADCCANWLSLPVGPGREYARRYQMSHFAALCDSQQIGNLLFATPWVHQRLREDAKQSDSLVFLLSDLLLTLPHLERTRSAQVRSMMDFLLGWGPALQQDSSLIDQWWTAAGTVTTPFPHAEDNSGSGGVRLLVPIIGPSVSDCSYPIPWPTSPRFHGAVCESTGGGASRLVFVSSRRGGPGDLLVYREYGGHCVRERLIRFPDNEGVFHLAGLAYPHVAALVRLPDGGSDLRVVDISTGLQQVALSDDRIVTCAVMDPIAPRFLLILRLPSEDGPATCLLRIVDENGRTFAERGVPYVITNAGRIDIVPFAPDVWGVIGQPAAPQPADLALYRLTSGKGHLAIEEIGSRVAHVNGACGLPGDRLAVCHRTDGSSFLSVIGADGTVDARIPLYTSPPRSTPRGYDLHHATVGQFLLNCAPAGWHHQYGIVLCAESPGGNEYYSVRPEPESIPRPLPQEVSRSLDTGDSTTNREAVLQMSNERLLFVFSTGGIVMEPGLTALSRIEGGVRTELTMELLGCRADGQVVICDGYINPDNAWSREDERLAQPPFMQFVAPHPLNPEFRRITRNGIEISVNRDQQSLETRRSAETLIRWQAPTGNTITDADEFDDGSLIVSVRRDSDHGGSWLYHIRQNDFVGSQICRLFNGDGEARIAQVAGRLALIERVDDWGHLLADRLLVDLKAGQSFPFNGSNSRLLPLPADHSLLLTAPSLSGFGVGQSFLYSPESNTRWTEVEGLEVSPQSVVHEIVRQDDEWLMTLVSVTEREWQWSLCSQVVQYTPREQLLISQSRRFFRLDGEISCWAHFGNSLILGFGSGRIEVRSLGNLDQVAAVGYTPARPDDLVVAQPPEGRVLVVSAGNLVWFPFAHL